jgi:hypothetical protein
MVPPPCFLLVAGDTLLVQRPPAQHGTIFRLERCRTNDKNEQQSVAFSLGILRSFVQAFVVRGNVMASGLTIWAGLAIGYTGVVDQVKPE